MDIALTDAVAAVRDELIEAAARGAGADVVFAVGEVTLEFAVELRQDNSVRAGFKAWVVSADAGYGSSRAATHRVSVKLAPRTPEGEQWLIHGDPDRSEGPGDVSGRIGR